MYPSTFAGLFDAAPMLSLSPLVSCFCFAVSAALHQPQEGQRRLLHGVKSLKAQCTIFKLISRWYTELCHRGPWCFDWAPPVEDVLRDWSASFIISACLAAPERIPEEDDMQQALVQVESKQRADPTRWRELQVELQHAHAQLAASLQPQRVQTLIAVLARIVSLVTAAQPEAGRS